MHSLLLITEPVNLLLIRGFYKWAWWHTREACQKRDEGTSEQEGSQQLSLFPVPQRTTVLLLLLLSHHLCHWILPCFPPSGGVSTWDTARQVSLRARGNKHEGSVSSKQHTAGALAHTRARLCDSACWRNSAWCVSQRRGTLMPLQGLQLVTEETKSLDQILHIVTCWGEIPGVCYCWCWARFQMSSRGYIIWLPVCRWYTPTNTQQTFNRTPIKLFGMQATLCLSLSGSHLCALSHFQ